MISSGIYINGVETKDLEKEFAEYIGSSYAIGVSSGTAALELVLKALPLKANDEVITVSHTAVPTISAIKLANLTPKLIDIDPESYTMSPEQLRKEISDKTKCVVLVHLYGQGTHIKEIKDICDERNIYLVEDCSQAHGALWNNRRLGSIGIAGCFAVIQQKSWSTWRCWDNNYQ